MPNNLDHLHTENKHNLKEEELITEMTKDIQMPKQT